jgi:dTDP-4-amino-4,6-dideoxygalactose transaminase
MGSLMLARNLFNIFSFPSENPFPELVTTFMGRDAISLAISYLELGHHDTVLLPSYICLEALKPFLGRTHVEYYEPGPKLAVDPDEIREKCDQHDVKMMMLINYFGFLQPYRKEIKKLCTDRGIVLMEDCAHSLLTEGSGETGDLSIYSIAKILPLPDGGGLKINKGGISVGPHYYPKIYSNILSSLIIFKSMLRIRADIFSRAWYTSRKKNNRRSGNSLTKIRRYLPISSFSCKGLGRLSFLDIVERRRRDFEFWLDMTRRSSQFAPLYNHIPVGVCPLGFPVKVENRDFVKARFQKEAIYLKTHWQLPRTVGREFVDSRRLSAKMLTLPVYPDLDRRGRETIQKLVLS